MLIFDGNFNNSLLLTGLTHPQKSVTFVLVQEGRTLNIKNFSTSQKSEVKMSRYLECPHCKNCEGGFYTVYRCKTCSRHHCRENGSTKTCRTNLNENKIGGCPTCEGLVSLIVDSDEMGPIINSNFDVAADEFSKTCTNGVTLYFLGCPSCFSYEEGHVIYQCSKCRKYYCTKGKDEKNTCKGVITQTHDVFLRGERLQVDLLGTPCCGPASVGMRKGLTVATRHSLFFKKK